MSAGEHSQSLFIQKIKDSIPSHLSLVDEMAHLLKISNDSAYRRIRCETLLNIEEINILCNHFRVPLDIFAELKNETVSFKYQILDHTESSFENYLRSLVDDLKMIRNFEEREITYAAKDIPIFHHFNFPELSNFKIFFWRKSVLNSPELNNKKFNSKEENKVYTTLGKEILIYYNQIPAVEIWTEETLNSTLKQVEYYWDSGFFETTEDALIVCGQLEQMIQHICDQAEVGSKFNPENKNNKLAPFQLYWSEVMIGNNNILVKMKNNQVTYLTHNTLNYLITSNPGFCAETEQSLKNLIKKSSLISGVSEKHRHQFFRKAFDSIRNLKERIK